MAKLIINEKEHVLPNGTKIAEFCRKEGVALSCNAGVCGSCKIHIVQGKDNLTSLTQEETDFGMDGRSRLACQCSILGGSVKIKC